MPKDLWERARRKDAAARARQPGPDDSIDYETLQGFARAARCKPHRPRPKPESKKVYGTFEDIVLDDVLIAKMMANMAAHGMTLEDLAG